MSALELCTGRFAPPPSTLYLGTAVYFLYGRRAAAADNLSARPQCLVDALNFLACLFIHYRPSKQNLKRKSEKKVSLLLIDIEITFCSYLLLLLLSSLQTLQF